MKTLYKMNNVCKYVGSLGKALVLTVSLSLLSAGAYAYDAHTIQQGNYYFDNTRTGWDKVYIRVGSANDDSKWISVFPMAKMGDNANMWQVTFGGDVTNVTHIQFANTDGYTSGDHIFDGNNIPAGNKTKYIELTGGDWVIGYPLTVAFAEMDDGAFRNIAPGQPMPGGFSNTAITLGGKSISDTFGYFNPSASVTLSGTATATYSGTTPTNDCVTITMNYNKDGATVNEKLALMGANKSTKTASKSVTLPSTVGKHTFTYFLKAGGYPVTPTATTAYYHIVGLTGQSLEFGAIDIASKKMLTEKLSNVWGGDNVNTVKATISGTGASAFSFSATDATLKTKDISISNKAGSADIYFSATGEGNYSATLTLEMTCGDGSKVTKTYTLKGVTKSADPTVMLGAEPVYLDGPKAILSGYLKYYACSENIKEAGIVWGTTANPTVSDNKIICSTGSSLTTGASWSGTTATNLTPSQIYHYRAYVKNTATQGVFYSPVGTFSYSSTCVYPIVGDTVYVTVDNKLTDNVPCELKFMSIDAAITAIKDNATFCTGKGSTNKLLKHIVLQVAPNKASYTGTGDHIVIDGINNYTLDGTSKVMIVRSAESGSRPTLVKLRVKQSKNVILDNLRIYADGASDDALDIRSSQDADWHDMTVGEVAGSKVVVKNCYIESHGFTGIQMWEYDDVTFENNDIECFVPESATAATLKNLVCWGSSMKVSQCSNVKFLRNNFRGSHTTSLWLQGLRGGLFMNNVFWNSNDSYYADFKNNTCFVRLVTQFPDAGGAETTKSNVNEKLGFYYNTFFLADNSNVTTERRVDFFRLASGYTLENDKGETSSINKNLGQNHAGTINFKYNNCYSYDRSSVIGSNNNDGNSNSWNLGNNQNWCASINHNNFWSWRDDIGTATVSVFNIPTSCTGTNKNYFVNVYEQVCKTTNDPKDLIVKGGDMNFGKHIESGDDASKLGAENIYNDRLRPSNGADAIRKVNGQWTLGAYQQTDGNDFAPVKVIVWTGEVDGDWDNRGNWVKENGDKLTCVDNIDPDVKVIIPALPEPEPEEERVNNYPTFPNKFSGTRTDKTQETVNAGHGVATPTKFASSIELEYGAAIKNIEALNDDGTRRYAEATNHFTAGRSEWILVGTVVRPFTNGSKNEVRLVQSGDYFIADHEPHVYMHEAQLNGESANWQTSFTSLEQAVPYDRVFAIRIPDEYGPYKYSASTYYTKKNPNPAMVGDAIVPKTFDFNGWFLNDEIIPEYNIKGKGNVLLCNTYPANIDIATAILVNNGSFKVYDYELKNFYEKSTGEIKTQNGFLFLPTPGTNDGFFRITPEMLLNTSTKYKSTTVQNPMFSIMVLNTNGSGGSAAKIVYDELKSDQYVESVDLINTVIDDTPAQPEISVVMYGKELDKVVIPDLNKSIPLKLVCGKKMTVEFGPYEKLDMEKAVLEDRETGNSYDLLTTKPQIALAKGTYEGRFFLNLGAEEKEDIPTEGDDVTSSTSTIDLYGDGSEIIISSSENVILKSAEITDMSGNTTVVTLKNAHYNRVKVNGAQGVYVVKAIGDTKTETAKVIVK